MHPLALTSVACLALFAFASVANAQATRTWVSGVGDDANPCSRTAPCKTFAGAISKTAAKGEINALDPGGFGTVTITKSITLDGQGTLAGILSAGVDGIIINAAATDTVILRNLSIDGAGTGSNGIRYLAGGKVQLDNVTISGVSTSVSDPAGNGIYVALTASAGNLVVTNSTIIGGKRGVYVQGPAGGSANVLLERVVIDGPAIAGFDAGVGFSPNFGFASTSSINNSVLSRSGGYGVVAESGQISVTNSVLTNNAIAVQAVAGALVRISNNQIFDNTTGIGCGGTIASANDNLTGNNGAGGCNPNATITLK